MQDGNKMQLVTLAETTRTVGKISLFPGTETLILDGSAADYLEMRAAHLAALTHLITSADFDSWDETVRSDAKWLAASLADEVRQLVPVALYEASTSAPTIPSLTDRDD